MRMRVSLILVMTMLLIHRSIGFLGHWPSSRMLQVRKGAMRALNSGVPERAVLESGRNFITNIIDANLSSGANGGRVVTRFPPEPNGYLHLGHAKAINFNFAVAKAYSGVTHMRFDDTNPAKEDVEYVNSILKDVRWLVTGKVNPDKDPWYGPVRHASDYFPILYDAAEYLIKQGLAYVDHLTAGSPVIASSYPIPCGYPFFLLALHHVTSDEMKLYRGSLTEPGRDSPYRTRGVEENLQLFRDMRAGKFRDGECVLRAKIDMTSPNVNLRDPTLYRIKKEPHPITGTAWCIYPMYDFAHALSDALEGITHSLCTLEFDVHRPLYDWCIDQVLPSGLLPYRTEGWRPHQYEFSRLNLQYTVLSKRKLITLVANKHVDGWDDPRLPTISGLRRRGFPASAVRLFADRVGISKAENNIDVAVLEECAREVLDSTAPRLFAAAHPLKLKITNWDRPDPEIFSVESHPKRPELGHRDIPFTGELFIDRNDFFDTKADLLSQNGSEKGQATALSPPKGYKRLLLGGQVRLKNAYVVACHGVVRDALGEVTELLCTYEPATRAGRTPPGSPKVRGIIQWVSQESAVPVDLHLYDRLFVQSSPGKDQPDGDFLRDLNPASLEVVRGAVVEPSVLSAIHDAVPAGEGGQECDLAPGTFQFERIGYFALDRPATDNTELTTGADNRSPLRFNRIVTLKDTWQNAFVGTDGSDNLPADKDGAAPQSTAAATKGASQASAATAAVVEDIRRVELRVGQILSAAQHPDADTLYVLQVRVGDETEAPAPSSGGTVPTDEAAGGAVRTIISGLAGRIPLESLVNQRVVVVCNLKPSKMRGVVSEGMLLAASKDDRTVELLSPPSGAPVGELIHIQGYDAPAPDPVLKSKSAQEVWKRVAGELRMNAQGEAMYGSGASLLLTLSGPCVAKALFDAPIR